MYTLYKIFGKLSKGLSNALMLIMIPTSIIFCAAGWALFCIKDILSLVFIDPGWFEGYVGDGASALTRNELFDTLHWVGLAIGLFFTIVFIILIVAWICKKVLYKSIAGFQITRNKEWRNKDINKAIEKLEDYRYRD